MKSLVSKTESDLYSNGYLNTCQQSGYLQNLYGIYIRFYWKFILCVRYRPRFTVKITFHDVIIVYKNIKVANWTPDDSPVWKRVPALLRI